MAGVLQRVLRRHGAGDGEGDGANHSEEATRTMDAVHDETLTWFDEPHPPARPPRDPAAAAPPTPPLQPRETEVTAEAPPVVAPEASGPAAQPVATPEPSLPATPPVAAPAGQPAAAPAGQPVAAPAGRPATALAPSVPAAPQTGPTAEAEPAPSPGWRRRSQLRRRLRFVRRARELALRDLGGLVLEMRRFDRERPDLLDAKVQALNALEQERRALEAALGDPRDVDLLRVPGVASCPRCGALHPTEAHFCASCGVLLKSAAGLPAGALSTSEAASPAAPTGPQPA